LERDYTHSFFSRVRSTGVAGALFGVGFKDDLFEIRVQTLSGQWRDTVRQAQEILAQGYGFDIKKQPIWTEGCVVSMLHDKVVDGSLRPAMGNILLVGDAAGLLHPTDGDGIGTAINTGLLAADSVEMAAQEGRKADTLYLAAMEKTIARVSKIVADTAAIRKRSSDDILQAASESMIRATK